MGVLFGNDEHFRSDCQKTAVFGVFMKNRANSLDRANERFRSDSLRLAVQMLDHKGEKSLFFIALGL